MEDPLALSTSNNESPNKESVVRSRQPASRDTKVAVHVLTYVSHVLTYVGAYITATFAYPACSAISPTHLPK